MQGPQRLKPRLSLLRMARLNVVPFPDLFVTSATRVSAASTGGVTASTTRRAVRTTAIAATAAAIARRPTIAAVTIRRPWLHDGLPHVELRTRIASPIAAGSRPTRITRARRGPVPVASALAAARGSRAVLTAPGGLATSRRWRKGLPLAPVRLAMRGCLRRRTSTWFARIRSRHSGRRRPARFRSTRL